MSGCLSDNSWLTTTMWLIGATPCLANQVTFPAWRVGKQHFQVGMIRLFSKHRIEFAIDQHLDDLLARRRPLRRIAEFGDMGILEGDPVDRVEIDAIVVGQNAAQPGAGRGGEGADADSLAVEISSASVFPASHCRVHSPC